jgi:hypothetical protein
LFQSTLSGVNSKFFLVRGKNMEKAIKISTSLRLLGDHIRYYGGDMLRATLPRHFASIDRSASRRTPLQNASSEPPGTPLVASH